MADVVTIQEAVRRAKEDNLPISEHALRTWVRTGTVPVRKIGSKSLLFYPNLVRFLRCDDGSDNSPAPTASVSGIRRIDL